MRMYWKQAKWYCPADEVRHDPRVMEAYLGGRVE